MHLALMTALLLAGPLSAAAFALGGSRLPELRSQTTPFCLRSSPAIRRQSSRAPALSLRAQEMSEAEKKEYEALLAEARRIKGTFDQMIGGAFGGEEPQSQKCACGKTQDPNGLCDNSHLQKEAPKGFNIPIDDYDEELTPDLETEAWEPPDLEAMTPEERSTYERGIAQNTGDEAFEAAESAIKAGDMKLAWQKHEEMISCYTQSGILSDDSIFKASFMDSINDQRRKLPPK